MLTRNEEIKWRSGWLATAAAALLTTIALSSPRVYADSVSAPPPLSANVGASYESLDGVYYGFDVPENRSVQIQRMIFNQDGYELLDKAGETIKVAFVKDNLYTMQFAAAGGQAMYFANIGGHPVIYLPKNGYLIETPPYSFNDDFYAYEETGVYWYPFTKDFYPTDPVFMGPAPTWGGFLNMPWYPRVRIQGGYWSSKPVGPGVSVAPTPGLLFTVDGHPYRDWAGFMSYLIAHPTPSGRPFDHGHR
ncbi:MAG TPA: hypothetical protein VFW40_13660 [Capsulimonadaceae bacterium]|nr:hypothetical protein [Capsulimonadaceae bacterium]